MKNNMGTLDRALWILAAIGIIVLYYTGLLSGAIAVILLVFVAIFILISFCPLYYPFGFSTKKVERKL
jgi:hypothetical protein